MKILSGSRERMECLEYSWLLHKSGYKSKKVGKSHAPPHLLFDAGVWCGL